MESPVSSVRVTETERKWLESGLKTAGYQNEKNVFTHMEGPTFYLEKTEGAVVPRVSRIDILLSTAVDEKKLPLGKQYTAQINGQFMQIRGNRR